MATCCTMVEKHQDKLKCVITSKTTIAVIVVICQFIIADTDIIKCYLFVCRTNYTEIIQTHFKKKEILQLYLEFIVS